MHRDVAILHYLFNELYKNLNEFRETGAAAAIEDDIDEVAARIDIAHHHFANAIERQEAS